MGDDPRLPFPVERALEAPHHRLFPSAVSAFEIAIKHGLGKLPLDASLQELLTVALEANRIELLPILPTPLAAYAELPFPATGHRDPFDRILVAQARVEGLGLVTKDRAFADYGFEPSW